MRLIIVVAAVLFVVQTTFAAGDQTTRILKNVVSRDQIQRACAPLSLSDAQQMALDRAYDSYARAITELDSEVLVVCEEVGREVSKWNEALREGGDEVLPDHVRALNRRERLAREAAKQEANQLLDRMFAELEGVLTEQQIEQISSVRRALRRMVHLTDPDDRTHGAVFRIVDFVQLVEASPELEWLVSEQSFAAQDAHDGCPDADEEFTEILHRYEIETDAQLTRKRASETLRGDRILILPDTPFGRRYYQLVGQEWRSRYDPMDRAAAAIARLLRECRGRAVAETWEQRYWEAVAPQLLVEPWLDANRDRIRELCASDESLRDAVQEQFNRFRQQRHALIREVFQAKANANGGTETSWLDYGRSVLRLNDHHQHTIEDIRNLFPQAQQQTFDAWVSATRYRQPRAFEPIILSNAMREALGRPPRPQIVDRVWRAENADAANTNDSNDGN